MLSGAKPEKIFLIKEADLNSSYEGEFIDSEAEDEDWDAGKSFLVLDKGTTEPTLENFLENLSVDKPKLSGGPATVALNSSPSSKAVISNTSESPSSACRSSSSIWLNSAFKWEVSTESNFIIDQGSSESRPIILYATKMKLIEKLTTVLDYGFMDTFLLTLEMTMHPMDFVTCLLSRLAQAFRAVPGWNSADPIDPEVVKMRGLIVLQHWAGIYGPDLESSMDFSIRKLVIEALDFIWQHSRTLSQSDQRFLIKIRRLYDPHGEISVASAAVSEEERNPDILDYSDRASFIEYENGNGGYNESETTMSSRASRNGLRSWPERLRLHFKSIFSKRPSTLQRKLSSTGSQTSSFVLNSFSSSDAECEDVSALILSERSRSLASILAILEWDIFNAIQRSEMVAFPTVKESPQLLGEKCPNLQRSIEHFNSMCQWFVQLLASQDDDPCALLAKLIRLAIKCVLTHNYNSALQIILALQSPAISGRSDLWTALPTWERRLARDLAVFGSPVKNFKNVRKAQDQVSSEDLPLVPFNGLLLSDLVFNWERRNNSPSSIDNNFQHGNVIPFYKCHVASKIVRQFNSFKQPKHEFNRSLNERERQLYSYFADIGRLGGEFSMT